MRIVGGRLKGRALEAPKDGAVRPTSDRVREALFNILEHGIEDFELQGCRVLDLFAGTGALGIEAISRGAGECTFVENAAPSRALIQENVQSFGLGGVTTIFRRSALEIGPAGGRAGFNLVFADPPYEKGLGEQAFAAAVTGGWLADGAVLVLEESANAEINWPAGCEELDRRRYGSTQVAIAKLSG